jgi:hypothetical protein
VDRTASPSGRRFAVSVVLIAALSSANCASQTPAIRAEPKAQATKAYLYGRFEIRATNLNTGRAIVQNMGLVIRCNDGAWYGIRFSSGRDVQVIEADPSLCVLDEMVYAGSNGVVLKSRRPPQEWVRPLRFEAGKAYYLGDYFTKGEYLFTYGYPYSHHEWTWDMEPVDHNFEATTEEMKRRFAYLALLPVEDKRLAPRRRPPGLGPEAPLPPAHEAPLSPARIARIAPFTKRRYSTPAECAEACRTGQCLPFRGEAGPAMTCIVRCTRDGDCPEGLACNCASGGSQCRAIATTAEDPMDGFCLSIEPTGPRC